jgi:alkaline phosphatase D
MIAMWDDHESANNSWAGGAENHQPATEGSWEVRKAAAIRAYHEWMPVAEAEPRRYEIGELATIIMPETRLTARSEPLDYARLLRGQTDNSPALAGFRDYAWRDPTRTLMGMPQETWVAAQLGHSRRRGVTWQILAQQVLMGHVAMPFEMADWVPAAAPAAAKTRAQILLAASKLDLPLNLDSWDGFPAARQRLLEASLAADANLLVLSGDTHNAWANDLVHGNTPVGVEVGGHSVTSPGNERDLPHLPAGTFSRALVSRNPHLKWANNHQRGYATVELTPNRATAEWLFLETVRERSTTIAASHRMTMLTGQRRFATQ